MVPTFWRVPVITCERLCVEEAIASGVAEEGLEAEVHMLLDVAVEEGGAGLVGDKINSGAAVEGHDDRILNNTAGGLAVEVHELEEVAVEMEGMGIVCAIAENEAMALAPLEDEFVLVGIFLAVDKPAVKFSGAARNFLENHFDGAVGRGLGRGAAEQSVVPGAFRGRPAGLVVPIGIFNDDAETGVANILVRRTEDPDAGLIHLDDGIHAFAGADKNSFGGLGNGYGVAVEGDDLKEMARKSNALIFDGTGVEQVHEHALAGLYADGIADAESFVIDRKKRGGDFEAVGAGVKGGGLFRMGRTRVVVIIVHGVSEKGLPIAEGEKKFLIVPSGIVGILDNEESKLTGVGTAMEVAVRHGVGVIPARARGPRRELEAPPLVGRNQGRAFFFGAVHFSGNQKAVPVNKLGGFGVIDYVHGHGDAFAHAEDRARRRAVVADSADDAIGSELDGNGRDFEHDVGFARLLRRSSGRYVILHLLGHRLRLRLGGEEFGHAGFDGGEGGEVKQIASVHDDQDAGGSLLTATWRRR